MQQHQIERKAAPTGYDHQRRSPLGLKASSDTSAECWPASEKAASQLMRSYSTMSPCVWECRNQWLCDMAGEETLAKGCRPARAPVPAASLLQRTHPPNSAEHVRAAQRRKGCCRQQPRQQSNRGTATGSAAEQAQPSSHLFSARRRQQAAAVGVPRRLAAGGGVELHLQCPGDAHKGTVYQSNFTEKLHLKFPEDK